MNIIYQGGPIFMVPLVLLLLGILFLAIKSFRHNTSKSRKLISELGLFSFVFGVLGFVVGLLSALQEIAAMNGDIAPALLAGGLKVGLIAPSFGLSIFLIAKFFVILLTLKEK